MLHESFVVEAEVCGSNVSFSGHFLKICCKDHNSQNLALSLQGTLMDCLEYCLGYRVLRNRTENLSKIK